MGRLVAFSLTLAIWGNVAWADELSPAAAKQLTAFDADGDGSVRLAEFVAHAGNQAAVWRRDFRLCDWNGDDRLSPAEFAACPALFPADQRGPWPDPLDDLLNKYVALFDRHWDQWDVNRNGEISQGEFVSGTLALSIPPLKTAAVKGCDPDGNGLVTREEARGVLELLLGQRSSYNRPLRENNGQVINVARFRRLDTDESGFLSPAEILTATFDSSTPAQALRILDIDRDSKVLFDEWCQAPRYAWIDPIDDFRRMDTDLNARLDSDELNRGVPPAHRLLAKYLLPGFDPDGDGSLSLAEYRLCPLGVPVVRWDKELRDANDDGRLVFEEFLHDDGQYRLLAWEYFQRLDWNADSQLDFGEFPFRTRQPDALFTIRQDGTGWRRLWQPAGYRDLESVAVSPDGQLIACVRWKRGENAMETASELCVLDREGRELHMLGSGRSPSWTPSGLSLVCRRRTQGQDLVSTVSLDGQAAIIEQFQYNAVWSPDGSKLASIGRMGLRIRDGGPGELNIIFDREGHPFGSLGEHICWSPDGRWLCLRCEGNDHKQQIVTVDAGGAELGFRIHDTMEKSLGNIAWHPRGDRIVFSKFCPERGRMQLYEFNPDRNDSPRLFPGQDPHRHNTDSCWTPDGTTLLVISGDY